MRSAVAGLVLLLFALPAFAGTPPRADVSSSVRTQANAYANQMIETIRYIQSIYFRKVSGAALVKASVVGLYEVAREPLPSGLKAELARAESDDDLRRILVSAREALGDSEVVQSPKAIYISTKALTRVLDPYSGFPSRNDSRRAFTSSPGVTGIGVELETDTESGPENFLSDLGQASIRQPGQPGGPVRIVEVLPGGPAQIAGLRPGDVITQIDGRDLDATTAPQAVPRLSVVAESPMSLTVKRPEHDQQIHVKLTPVMFRPETVFGIRRHVDQSWDYWLDAKEKIGYARIGFIDHWYDQFSGEPNGGTDVELHGVLSELLRSGMRGLVLDLRGCPGGFINPAVSLIGFFAKDALVATTKTANNAGQEPNKYSTSAVDDPLVTGIPIIVLVNEDTIGGGEMIAAALRDNHVAEIAGQRTFGKGSVQTTRPLPNSNVQYKLTTGLIYRKNGNPLQRMPDKPGDPWGVSPDPGLEIPLTPDMNKQLKEWMHQQVLRPGDVREKLPLDDPENDPARQFALRAILKRVK